MMAVDWKKGDFVEMVDLAARAPAPEKPLAKLWYMLAVRPGKDATVMRTFRRHGIDAYSPQIKKTKVARGRKCEVVEPLFPGLIIIPDYETNIPDYASDGVIGLVMFGEFFMRLRPKDVADIRNIEAGCNVPLSKQERMYATGQLVRVVDGPFAYFGGRIEKLDSKGRLSVLVSIFGRMSLVTLDEGQVEPDPTSTGVRYGHTIARHRQRRNPRAAS